MFVFRSIPRRFYCLIVVGTLLISVFVSVLEIQPVAGQGSWWNHDWSYRKLITINHTKVATDLLNFAVLIDVTDADLASKAQSDGDDIVFSDSSGTKLNHEIEFYNGTNGQLTAWVKVPTLSSTVDTVLYMYYGNPSVSSQENVAGTWDSNYVLVQHLSESSQ